MRDQAGGSDERGTVQRGIGMVQAVPGGGRDRAVKEE